MRVLVVENYENTGLGQIGVAIGEAGGEIDMRRPWLGDTLPANADGHDALVVLGGVQNALADDFSPYFPALLDLIRDFEGRDRAIAGVCLGSQLLARAFGGENRIGGAREFGWQRVELTAAAADDAVLGALPPSFPIFQWHDDTFTLPERAIRLAASAVAENQAFRVGRAAYGFQFHFEADTELVRQWSRTFAALVEKRSPGWSQVLDEEVAAKGLAADEAGLSIARNWVATIGARAGVTILARCRESAVDESFPSWLPRGLPLEGVAQRRGTVGWRIFPPADRTLRVLARFNAMVINFVQDGRQMHSGMTPVKAVLLTFAMLSAIAVGGLGIYAADAASGHNAVDGYGVTVALD